MQIRKEMAEREVELQIQHAEEKEKAMAQIIKQMEQQREKELVELKERYIEIYKARMTEQVKLLSEGFDQKADEMRHEIERLSRSYMQVFQEDYFEPLIESFKKALWWKESQTDTDT